MYCNNCGVKNPDGANFCFKCGATLNVPMKELLDKDDYTVIRHGNLDIEKENFRKKLRCSVENDMRGLLDFVVIQVPHGDFVQFCPSLDGGYYVEFAVGESLSSWTYNPYKYDKYDKLYQQYGYKYGTGNPEDDFYIKEYHKGSEEDMIREIPDLIVAIKGNCLSVCLYDESLKSGDDNVPVLPVKKKFWLFSFADDGCLMILFKLLLIGMIGGVSFGGIMFIISEYFM